VSEAGDLLSQWRAYGAGGGGVSIGFQAEVLSKIADDQKFSRVECQYSAETQLELVDKILKKHHGRYLEEIKSQWTYGISPHP